MLKEKNPQEAGDDYFFVTFHISARHLNHGASLVIQNLLRKEEAGAGVPGPFFPVAQGTN